MFNITLTCDKCGKTDHNYGSKNQSVFLFNLCIEAVAPSVEIRKNKLYTLSNSIYLCKDCYLKVKKLFDNVFKDNDNKKTVCGC